MRQAPSLSPRAASAPTTTQRPTRTPRRRRWGSRVLGTLLALMALPVLVVGLLRFVNPPVTAFMLGDRGDEVRQHHWVPLDTIPRHVPLAMVAAEDQTFPMHRGFDVAAIRRALDHNERGGRMRGASTLSQQVARNLFLWRGRSWVRKALEVPLTLLIEGLWSKHRILEVYVNIAELGRGIYGVEAAAQAHWGVPAAQLSGRQAALLAATLPSPRRYSATQPGTYVASRADWIEQQMAQLGPAWLPLD